jgi:hypothetical protein
VKASSGVVYFALPDWSLRRPRLPVKRVLTESTKTKMMQLPCCASTVLLALRSNRRPWHARLAPLESTNHYRIRPLQSVRSADRENHLLVQKRRVMIACQDNIKIRMMLRAPRVNSVTQAHRLYQRPRHVHLVALESINHYRTRPLQLARFAKKGNRLVHQKFFVKIALQACSKTATWSPPCRANFARQGERLSERQYRVQNALQASISQTATRRPHLVSFVQRQLNSSMHPSHAANAFLDNSKIKMICFLPFAKAVRRAQDFSPRTSRASRVTLVPFSQSLMLIMLCARHVLADENSRAFLMLNAQLALLGLRK